MTYYETHMLFLLGLLFPLENFIFLVVSEEKQVRFLRYRAVLVYGWSAIVFAVCLWNSFMCLEMIESATYYGEEMGYSTISHTEGPMLQL